MSKKDDIRKFEITTEEFNKMVNNKLSKFADILAPEEFAADFEALEKDIDSVPEARMDRIVAEMYAGQAALFAAGPRNIVLLANAGLITPEDGQKLFVVAALLEAKVEESLERVMKATEEKLDEESKKPDLRVVH